MSHILRLKTKALQDKMSKFIYPHLNANELDVIHTLHHTSNTKHFTAARINAFGMKCPERINPTLWDSTLWALSNPDEDMCTTAAKNAALSAAVGNKYKSGFGITSDGESVIIDSWAGVWALTSIPIVKTRCHPNYMDWLKLARPGAFKFDATTQELKIVS